MQFREKIGYQYPKRSDEHMIYVKHLRDTTLPSKEAVIKIHKEAYRVKQELIGVKPGDPTYNEDRNIYNYKKTV